MEPERHALQALFEAVADGRVPDWDSVQLSGAGEGRQLEQLRIVGALAAVHREISEQETAEMDGPADRGGATWGPLVLIEKIAEGAFGEVYRAEDPTLRRAVALKLLRPGRQDVERTLDEARLLARVKHANVVTIHGAEQREGRVGLWMEDVRGRTLEELLAAHGTFGAEECALIGRDLCRALSAVHAAGLVHGDVKARNVMREQGGRIVLMDFGSGRDLLSDDGTAPGTGTPLYAAPELFEGGRTSVVSDLYAVGVLLFHLATADYPVRAGTLEELRAMHRHGRARRLRELRPDLPDWFVRVVESAVSPQPDRRPRSAAELMDALSRGADATRATGGRRGRHWPRAWLAAVSVAAAAAVPFAWRPSVPATGALPMAVLPFANATGDSSWTSLSSGLADDVASELQRLKITVRGRSSASHLSGSAPSNAAERLGVERVLEGAVGVTGGKITLRVALAGPDGRALWTRDYAEALDEVGRLHERVASDVARLVGVEPASETGAPRRATGLRAYQAYHTGRVYWEQRTPASLQTSVQYFRQAAELDPSYAAPWAGLADAYISLGVPAFGSLTPQEARRRAVESAVHALELDPRAPEPQASLGFIAYFYNWDWPAAEARFQKALELGPSYSVAHHWYADYLNAMGRQAEAEVEIQEARRLEPLSILISRDVAWHQFFRREYAAAADQLRATLSIDPRYTPARTLLARALVEDGATEQGLRQLQLLGEDVPRPSALGFIAYALAAAGRADEADRLLVEMIRLRTQAYVSPYAVGLVLVRLGRHAEALDWFERAFVEQDGTMVNLKMDPRLAPLHGEPRYRALVRRMKFPG